MLTRRWSPTPAGGRRAKVACERIDSAPMRSAEQQNPDGEASKCLMPDAGRLLFFAAAAMGHTALGRDEAGGGPFLPLLKPG